MKSRKPDLVEQPRPFTPGITKGQVRQHAYERFRDHRANLPLTTEDWVVVEKDLLASMEEAAKPEEDMAY